MPITYCVLFQRFSASFCGLSIWLGAVSGLDASFAESWGELCCSSNNMTAIAIYVLIRIRLEIIKKGLLNYYKYGCVIIPFPCLFFCIRSCFLLFLMMFASFGVSMAAGLLVIFSVPSMECEDHTFAWLALTAETGTQSH